MMERSARLDPAADPDLLHRQIQVAGLRGQLHEVDDGGPERRLRHLLRADGVRRDDAIRARAPQLRLGILGLGAADDEELRRAARGP